MAWKQFFREEKESWAATQLLMVKFLGNVLFCKATTGDTLSSLWSVGLFREYPNTYLEKNCPSSNGHILVFWDGLGHLLREEQSKPSEW